MADGEIKLHDKTKKVLTDWRLASWGIPYTAYTTLGTQLMVEGLYQGELPTTIQEATNMIKGIIK